MTALFRDIGHGCTTGLFLTALLAAFSYFVSTRYASGSSAQRAWIQYATYAFYLHLATLISTITLLYILLFQNRFEYHYVWNHSVSDLPTHFKIAALWEGQEGSFLLWMAWNALFGLHLSRKKNLWRPYVLGSLSFVQAGLASMVLGLYIGSIKIGNSPFLLLAELSTDPIFSIHPDFVPPDGTGLNPLLQNIWMVIHPPVLFAGFALLFFPLAFAWAGTYKRLYTSWIPIAMQWMKASIGVLGLGIMMGAYWAYETLNFGGYWSWDPVENAVYIPWLIAVAALHSMHIYQRKQKALRMSFVLITLSFGAVLYASFLTRSGILGDTSVHAFTNLGLGTQLLLLLFTIISISSWLGLRHAKGLKAAERPSEKNTYSVDFWMLLGIGILLLMGLQVLLPTSIPVLNELIALFGGSANWAPPADPIGFYTPYQWLFGLLVLALSGTAQLFTLKNPKKQLRIPLLSALLIASLSTLVLPLKHASVAGSLFVGCYAVGANAWTLILRSKQNPHTTGAAMAHIGVALMFIGILFSSANERITSTNYTGMLWHKEFPDDINRDNLLLFQNETRPLISGGRMTYRGIHRRLKGIPFYVPEAQLRRIDDRHVVLTKDLQQASRIYAQAGDTMRLYSKEKKFFAIRYQDANGYSQHLYPRAYESGTQLLYEPHIRHQWTQDLYVHVRTFSDPEARQWTAKDTLHLRVKDSFIVNDYVGQLKGIRRLANYAGIRFNDLEGALEADIELLGEENVRYSSRPLLLLRENQVGWVSDEVVALGIRMRLLAVDPKTESFTFGVETTQKPWVIVEAREKPAMNLLWSGVLVMLIGIGLTQLRPKHL